MAKKTDYLPAGVYYAILLFWGIYAGRSIYKFCVSDDPYTEGLVLSSIVFIAGAITCIHTIRKIKKAD